MKTKTSSQLIFVCSHFENGDEKHDSTLLLRAKCILFCFKNSGEKYDSIDQLGTLAPLSWINYRWPLSQLWATAGSSESVQRAVGHFVYPYVVEQSQKDLISYNTSHYYCKSIAFYLLYVPNLFIQLCLMFTLYFRPFIIASFTVYASLQSMAVLDKILCVQRQTKMFACVQVSRNDVQCVHTVQFRTKVGIPGNIGQKNSYL